MVYRGL
ncbi:hypothetical protein N7530_010747 [Penicillium desertorum]|nr:hypothetical protein N7530_010747 [Penicillium desertorum]